MDYETYINSRQWKQRRYAKLRKAIWHGRYVLCNGCQCFVLYSMGDIHVHHRTYKRLGAERESDLVVLCSGCHNYLHRRELPAWWSQARAEGKFASLGRSAVSDVMSELIASGLVEPENVYLEAVTLLAPKIGPVWQRRGRQVERPLVDFLRLFREANGGES